MRKLVAFLFVFALFVVTVTTGAMATAPATSSDIDVCLAPSTRIFLVQEENLALNPMSDDNLVATIADTEKGRVVVDTGEIAFTVTGFGLLEIEENSKVQGIIHIAGNNCANDNDLARTDIPGSATSGLMITLTS